MKHHNSSGSILKLLQLAAVITVLSLRFCIAAENGGPWLDGWKFRTEIKPVGQAQSYDVWLDHHGLSQTDGRDIRVTDSAGKFVSCFISYCGSERSRVLFDGRSGAERYYIYFGNLDQQLPEVPASGLIALGEADWQPSGGFTCTTYKASAAIREYGPQMMSAVDVYNRAAEIRKQAEAGQKALDQQPAADDKQQKRKKPVPFVINQIYQNANPTLPQDPGEWIEDDKGRRHVRDRFFHVLRAHVVLDSTAEYYFTVGAGDGHTANVKVLYADKNYSDAAVRGWYRLSYGYSVHVGTGHQKLSAGRHLLELYTNAQNPNVRFRVGSPRAPQETLDGRFARYDAQAVTSGTIESKGAASANWLASAKELIDLGRYAQARKVCDSALAYFPQQTEGTTEFHALIERSVQLENSKFWLTEGKVPARTGFVPEAKFGPPFRVQTTRDNGFHDSFGVSSSVWAEPGLIYGLPFKVLPAAWGVTSGISFMDGTLYVGMKTGEMIAADYASGKTKWIFPGEGACYGTPLVYRNVVYYGGVDRRLYALDTERGRMLWNFPVRGWILGSPAADNDTVYFGARSAERGKGVMYAVDAILGVERWHTTVDGMVTGTPVLSGGKLFIGTHSGTFYALNAESGRTVWSFAASAAIRGGSCVGNGLVCFGDDAGNVHALNLQTGAPAWSNPCNVGAPVAAAPVMVGDVLYGGTANGEPFWGIDIEEGVIGWRHEVKYGGGVARQPLFAADHLVYSTRTCGIEDRYAINKTYCALEDFVMTAAPQETCYKATGEIAIDGKLDEAEWQQAYPLPRFRKENGLTVDNAVDARIMWKDTTLYVGIKVQDKDLIADAKADSVTIVLDPRRNGLCPLEFTVNAAGARQDVLLTGVEWDDAERLKAELERLKLEQVGDAWQPEWQAAVDPQGTVRKAGEQPADQDAGWTAEIAIPFASIPKAIAQPPQHNHVWTFNIIAKNYAGSKLSLHSRSLATTLDAGEIGSPSRWTQLRFLNTTVEQYHKEQEKKQQ